MKTNTLVILALFGATQAVVKHYEWDENTKYSDSGIRDFMEKNKKNFLDDTTTQVTAPAPKPNLKT